MGVKTKEEYIESLRQLQPTAYMAGEKITDIVDNPRLRPGIEATGATYELAQMDEYRDLMVTHSPLIGFNRGSGGPGHNQSNPRQLGGHLPSALHRTGLSVCAFHRHL